MKFSEEELKIIEENEAFISGAGLPLIFSTMAFRYSLDEDHSVFLRRLICGLALVKDDFKDLVLGVNKLGDGSGDFEVYVALHTDFTDLSLYGGYTAISPKLPIGPSRYKITDKSKLREYFIDCYIKELNRMAHDRVYSEVVRHLNPQQVLEDDHGLRRF